MANLDVGISNRKTVTVSAEHSPGHLGSTVVLSTPDMIRLMEEVCTAAIQPHLDAEDQTSVGVHVDVSHENAAREGEQVEVSGELVRVLGDRLFFAVEAVVGDRVIGRGKHQRHVIDRARFNK